MSQDESTLSSQQANQVLNDIESTKHAIIDGSRPPILLMLSSSISFAAIVFGYGMTEHENSWALAMWLGGIGFALSISLYLYTYRLLGIKPVIIPKSSGSIKLNIISALIFSILVFSSREIRLMGFAYAPHIAASLSAIIFFIVQYKYPTGEYIDEVKSHDDA